MPGSPFGEHRPIARLEIERILPEHDWECTNTDANGVHLFTMSGGIQITGQKEDQPMDAGSAGSSMQQVRPSKYALPSLVLNNK